MPRSHPGRATYSHGLVPACRTSPDPLRCFSRNLRESTPFTFQNCLARVRLIAFGTPCDTCAGIHRICRLKKENAAESNTDSSRMQPAVRDWQFRSTLAGFNLALRIPLHATIDSIQMGTVAPTRPHLIVQNDPTKTQTEDNAQRAQSFHLLLSEQKNREDEGQHAQPFHLLRSQHKACEDDEQRARPMFSHPL